MFYASYGKFVHRIIELYYRGELRKDDMLQYFLANFSDRVRGDRPSASIVTNYVNDACEYFKNFEPLPFEMVDVEKNFEIDIDGHKFVGVIDYLGEKDGEFYIVDHKSRALKQRSKRKKKTVNDNAIDDMLRQLYIYSECVYREHGKYPAGLCFNCFRNGEFIVEPFDKDAFADALEWAKITIRRIENAEEFYDLQDYFKCSWLCGYGKVCDYNIDG